VKSTVSPLEGNKVKLSVEVDGQEFDKAIDVAFRKIAREVRIPGFRPGKAPRKVLERRLGAEVGRQQALQDSLPEYYVRAIDDNDVDPIDAPEIEITSGQEEGDVAFDAVVEVRPEVQVPGYGSLRVELARPEPDEEEVDRQIDRMRNVQATLADVERPAQGEDVVTIDITGMLDGEVQEGLTAQDYSYTVDSGAVTPELDEQLHGAKAGDILEFEATHPDEDETRSLTFRVLVKQVRERVLPEADDEWASENSDFETIAELRDSIRERTLLVKKAQAQASLREKTGEALAKLVEAEIPQVLIDGEVQNRLQEFAMRLQAQGITPDQYFGMTGTSPDDFTNGLRSTAEDAVKVDLALRAVADQEAIESTDDELDDEIEQTAERVGEKPSRVRAEFERGGQLAAVRSDIRKRKALDWLLERVEVVDEAGKQIDKADLEITPVTAADGDDSDDDSSDETESSPA
jgi:trigger factor